MEDADNIEPSYYSLWETSFKLRSSFPSRSPRLTGKNLAGKTGRTGKLLPCF